MDWIQIFVNLILTGILLYVFQRVIDERSARRLEKFKAELQSTAFEKETKFSKLHETRVEVIAELYKKLSNFRDALNSVKSIMDDPDIYFMLKDEKLDMVHDAQYEFRAYYRLNHLYLPENLCSQIDIFYDLSSEVARAMHSASLDISLAMSIKKDSQIYIEGYKLSFSRVSLLINDKIAPLMQQLEGEFRNLLGG